MPFFIFLFSFFVFLWGMLCWMRSKWWVGFSFSTFLLRFTFLIWFSFFKLFLNHLKFVLNTYFIFGKIEWFFQPKIWKFILVRFFWNIFFWFIFFDTIFQRFTLQVARQRIFQENPGKSVFGTFNYTQCCRDSNLSNPQQVNPNPIIVYKDHRHGEAIAINLNPSEP